MPSHLHPRSRMTSSLFATTILASFFVVGLPHILPCPRPSSTRMMEGEQVFADENGRPRRRRRKVPRPTATSTQESNRLEDINAQDITAATASTVSSSSTSAKSHTMLVQFEVDCEDVGSENKQKRKRECPIPKPPSIIADMLGLPKNNDAANVSRERPPVAASVSLEKIADTRQDRR